MNIRFETKVDEFFLRKILFLDFIKWRSDFGKQRFWLVWISSKMVGKLMLKPNTSIMRHIMKIWIIMLCTCTFSIVPDASFAIQNSNLHSDLHSEKTQLTFRIFTWSRIKRNSVIQYHTKIHIIYWKIYCYIQDYLLFSLSREAFELIVSINPLGNAHTDTVCVKSH